MRPICFAATLLLALPSVMPAQSAAPAEWPLTPGSRIRILSPVLGGKAEKATTVAVVSDTLIFRRPGQSVNELLGTGAISRLEVSTQRHTRKAKGALMGLAIGAIGGAVLGYATYSPSECQSSPDTWCLELFDRGATTAMAATLLGALGTIVGAIVGAQEVDTWTPVRVP